MIVTLPVFAGDVSRLRDLLGWISLLGGARQHRAVLVADCGMSAGDVFELKELAQKAFLSVDIEVTDESVTGWPEGANALWLQAAKAAEAIGEEWLFLEPDAIPLKPGWLDVIDIRQRATAARYMGALVPCSTPGLPALHMDGVGVYPPNAYAELAGIVAANPKVAFDISTAGVVCKEARACNLFQHLWGEKGNPPRFAEKGIPKTAVFDLDYIRPEAAIFHRTKDGSLIRLLRQREDRRRTFIQLGRFGDIILLLPALKHIAETSGLLPRLIVASEFASVLEGVSYVEPISLPVDYYGGMPEARRYADEHFVGGTVLQCYADGFKLERSSWPDYMTSMWDRTGVPVSLMRTLPLVFDRRQEDREKLIVPQTNGKPYIIIAHKGHSSPFDNGSELLAALQHIAQIVDVSEMRTMRIYDMLGVMDRALGMVTIDTAMLHLANGCSRPYVALTVDGWCGSVPRGNCALEVKYSQFRQRLPEIVSTVESWL